MSEQTDLIIEIRADLQEAENLLFRANEHLKDLMMEIQPPDDLRPASAEDIVVGAAVWLWTDDERYRLMIIESVKNPSDPYKAFVAHDGCRYGLANLKVEDSV